MKRIVSKEQTEVTLLNELSDNSIVGIQWGDNKSMLVRTVNGYNDTEYRSLGNSEPLPKLLNTWYKPTVKEYVERAFEQGSHVEAYEFDSVKELFKWLSK